jgi:hypothetical protein
MAKRIRVEIRTLTGRSNFVSPQRAQELFQEKFIQWADGSHLYAYSVERAGQSDVSNILTKRCQWVPTQSGFGGPTVLQLV